MLENNKHSIFIENVTKFNDIDEFYNYFINEYDVTFIEFVQILNKYYEKNTKKIKKYLLKYFKNDYSNITEIISKYYKIIYNTDDYLSIKNKFSICSEKNMKLLIMDYFITTQSENVLKTIDNFDNIILSCYKNIKIQKPKNAITRQSARTALFSKSIKNKVTYDSNNDNIIEIYEQYKRNLATNPFQVLVTKYYKEFNLTSKNAIIYVNNITDDYFDEFPYILQLAKSIFVKYDKIEDIPKLNKMTNNIKNIIYLALYDIVNRVYLQQTVDNLTKNTVESLINCVFIDVKTGNEFELDDAFYTEFPLFLKKILCPKI